MKKSNQKGFMLIETLVVSTFVISTLVYLFIQFDNIKKSYDRSFRYNTISGLYGAKNISDYLVESGYSNLKTLLANSSLGFLDLTDCSSTSGNTTFCAKIVTDISAKKVLFVGSNLDTAITTLASSSTYDEELYKFIKNLSNNNAYGGLYRVVIEYNDNTFAAVAMR